MVGDIVIRTLVGISILVFVSKILGGFCSRFKVPIVMGEIRFEVIPDPAVLDQLIKSLRGWW